jgi:hypothetical protein
MDIMVLLQDMVDLLFTIKALLLTSMANLLPQNSTYDDPRR